MGKGKDFYGKDIAEVIEQACKELGASREELDIEVVITSYSIHYTKLYELGRISTPSRIFTVAGAGTGITPWAHFTKPVPRTGSPAVISFMPSLCTP